MTIILTVLATIATLAVIAHFAQKFALKKGWFASAMWSEKEQIWKVRGKYLSISQKIYDGIKHEHRTGEKRVKYVS